MKTPIKLVFTGLAVLSLIVSCSKEITVEEELNGVSATTSMPSPDVPVAEVELPSEILRSHELRFNLENVVVPSQCGPTPFNSVINESVSSNLDLLGLDWYGTYADINFFYTLTDEGPQTFGANGEYTNLVAKITRNLESFWDMPDEVSVRGQHNSTLEDEEKIIEVLTFWYGLPPSLAAFYADYFVNFVNVQSTFLTETPLLSFDGFAIALGGFLGQGDVIVVGDGIVELLSETGIEDKVVWNGIMAHEWAHQIQFNNFDQWYPNGAADNAPEATRTTELEADFFTAYFLTHKRGGTYNWKRVQDFMELFFNIGDCSFTSSGHHGTPIQRMEAARKGFEYAQSAQKNGMILSADAVHAMFLSELDAIVN